jgi:hypothetical protein
VLRLALIVAGVVALAVAVLALMGPRRRRGVELALTGPRGTAVVILLLGALAVYAILSSSSRDRTLTTKIDAPTPAELRARLERATAGLEPPVARELLLTLLRSAGPRERRELLDLIRHPPASALSPSARAAADRRARARAQDAARREEARRRARGAGKGP